MAFLNNDLKTPSATNSDNNNKNSATSPSPSAKNRNNTFSKLKGSFKKLPGQLFNLNDRMGCVNGKAVLTDDDLDYISTNTAVSRAEVDEYYKNFLEKHPDGKITKKEFKAMIQTCYPSTDTDKLEKHIFRMYDTNGDGYIDFREFMIVLYVMSSGSPEANLRQIFKVFDINNDGTISLKELKRIVKDLYSLFTQVADKSNSDNGDSASAEIDPDSASEEVLAQMAFNEMDKDNDGKVTKEEFVKACLQQEKFSTMLALKIIDVFVRD